MEICRRVMEHTLEKESKMVTCKREICKLVKDYKLGIYRQVLDYKLEKEFCKLGTDCEPVLSGTMEICKLESDYRQVIYN